jgi:biotin synthase
MNSEQGKTLEKLKQLYEQPLLELLYQAQTVRRRHRREPELQKCALLSIKTGGCPEDCAYCAQSARYQTGVEPQPLMPVEQVLARAREAKRLGATRFCMGTAWPRTPGGRTFERILEMIRGIRRIGLEACVTLGALSDEQAHALKAAGLTSYNHNLDTSRRFYPQIVTTHSYEQRLATIRAVLRAGLSLCCGCIIGMGEELEDRLMFLQELLDLPRPPDSIPINCLVPIPGTPLAERAKPVEPFELVRLIATTRITFPQARVRLSAGRASMSRELQALCFLAGADSVFFGEKLLTAPNQPVDEDAKLFKELGIADQGELDMDDCGPAACVAERPAAGSELAQLAPCETQRSEGRT